MSIYIETKGIAGSDIKTNISHCIALSIRLNIGVELSFNGYKRVIWNTNYLDDIFSDYNKWCKQQADSIRRSHTE